MATCNQDTRARAISLLVMGTFFIGWADGVALVLVTIDIAEQQDIGAASGICGSIRSAMGAICAAIYSTVLINRLTAEIPAEVIPAITKAGLPASSIPDFLKALTTGNITSLGSIQGATTDVVQSGVIALQVASTNSYKTVFLTSIAFSALALICAVFAPNTEGRLTNTVSAVIQREKQSTRTS